MEITWAFILKHLLVGCLVVVAAYWLRQQEKKRPQEQQRAWVVGLAYLVMIVGVIYGLGFGEYMVWQSLIENTR